MQFDHTNDKGENYALLYPKFEENEELKKVADEVGAKNALQFDRRERAFRLYENKLPDGVEVDKVFGKYASEAAKSASVAEREQWNERRQVAEQATGSQIDESRLYYPSNGNGDRKIFDQMRKDKDVKFYYSSRQGAFVHKDGPTEGFERFQTDEAKAAWKSEYERREETTRRRRENASEGIDVLAERANGREFLADNSQGFLLPGAKHEAVVKTQLDAMKKASDEELMQVFKITEDAKKQMERKQYGIQINAAQKANPDLKTEDFNKMTSKERHSAAQGKGLSGEDFSKLLASTRGFFAIREEAIDRGLLQSVENARQMQKGTSRSAGAAGGQQQERKQSGRSQSGGRKSGGTMAERMAEASADQGFGR